MSRRIETGKGALSPQACERPEHRGGPGRRKNLQRSGREEAGPRVQASPGPRINLPAGEIFAPSGLRAGRRSLALNETCRDGTKNSGDKERVAYPHSIGSGFRMARYGGCIIPRLVRAACRSRSSGRRRRCVISGQCGVAGAIGTGGQVVEKGARAGNLRTMRAEFGSPGSCCDSHCGDRRREGELVVLGRNAAGQQRRRRVSRGGRRYKSIKTRGERLG